MGVGDISKLTFHMKRSLKQSVPNPVGMVQVSAKTTDPSLPIEHKGDTYNTKAASGLMKYWFAKGEGPIPWIIVAPTQNKVGLHPLPCPS